MWDLHSDWHLPAALPSLSHTPDPNSRFAVELAASLRLQLLVVYLITCEADILLH